MGSHNDDTMTTRQHNRGRRTSRREEHKPTTNNEQPTVDERGSVTLPGPGQGTIPESHSPCSTNEPVV